MRELVERLLRFRFDSLACRFDVTALAVLRDQDDQRSTEDQKEEKQPPHDREQG